MKKSMTVIALIFILAEINFAQSIFNDSLKYLNQKPPGLKPEIFAPGLISTDKEYEFGTAFSKKGDKMYYAVRLNEEWKAEIRYTQLKNGKWSLPIRLNLDNKYSYNDPFISCDEDKLFFISDRPINGVGDIKDIDLWYIEKNGGSWSEPINVGEYINSEKNEFYITLTNSGTLYFASNIHTKKEDEWDYDIYYSKSVNGKFQDPVRMGKSVNSSYFECDAFISPEESYMIFCSSRPGGFGKGDLYICFKTKENNWSQAINMGKFINTDSHEFCPFVTKDGKYFFYSSNEDIYWVDAKIIDNFRK